jgi:hypothetical protein
VAGCSIIKEIFVLADERSSGLIYCLAYSMRSEAPPRLRPGEGRFGGNARNSASFARGRRHHRQRQAGVVGQVKKACMVHYFCLFVFFEDAGVLLVHFRSQRMR